VSPSSDRERRLAREHHERQQQRRNQARTQERRRNSVIAAVVAVLLVVGALVFLSVRGGDDDDTVTADPGTDTSATTDPSTEPSADPSEPVADGACAYTPTQGEAPAREVEIPTYDEATAKEPFTATLATNRGDIVIEALTEQAPCTTNSFRHLAEAKYFDDTSCHRLTTASDGIYVLQCGDPQGTGMGGPGYGFGIENAPVDGNFPAGTVAMARSNDPNSNGSQFFIVYQDTQLPTDGGGYTIFGTVTEGLDLVTEVAEAGVSEQEPPKPAEPVDIESVSISPKAE
jgi:peptidyl-prolyl cis-trans isomerase B (cyclophilin B)